MKIFFMGTPQAAIPSLGRLIDDGHDIKAVYTQPDRPSGRGVRIHESPVKVFACANRIPIYQPLKIKTVETLDAFRSHAADVAIVVAYGRILPDAFLHSFPKGAINLHFSLLPKYRGAAPVNWAIVKGETTTGVTTMQMDEGLDTGDILMQRETAIRPAESSADLIMRLSVIGAELLSETLSSLDSLPRQPQDDSKASFAPILNRADGVIDWSMKASKIVNRVRGFQPFPTAYTYFSSSKLTIWRADEAAAIPKSPLPGTIIAAQYDDLQIQCGESVLRVKELQLEGKRRLPVRDFLNGNHLPVGEVLG